MELAYFTAAVVEKGSVNGKPPVRGCGGKSRRQCVGAAQPSSCV